MKIRKNHFNLIEIVLTVAVIAFGVVMILGMLPKGLRAARNAGVESFATDVIDQMSNYLATSKSAVNELNEYSSIDLSLYDNLVYEELLVGSRGGFRQVNVYGVASNTSTKGLYAVVRGEQVAVSSDENEFAIDFSGLLYVWRSPAKYSCLKAAHNGEDADKKIHDCGKEKCDFRRETKDSIQSVQVNMELSYPLSLPYAERTKRYYSFEVSK